MRSWTDTDLIEATKQSTSYRDVIRKLGLRGVGANYTFIKSHMTRLGVDVSHFSYKPGFIKHEDKDVFKLNGLVSGSHLRVRFLKLGTIPYECQKCGNDGHWNGESLTLHLDHVNGNHSDCQPENLRWLCPNCHAQTETYARTGKKAELVELVCTECHTPFQRVKHSMSKNSSKRYCGRSCSAKAFGETKTRNIPERKVPHDLVRTTYVELGSYRATGMKLGLSDVAVKKIVIGQGWKK